MKIDRHNYEEFFILYMDNELPADERRMVELFAQQNADLQEELNMLMQSRMIPDNELVFADKDSLFKTGGLSAINMNNYEEWFLCYADNELNADQKKEVEKFITNRSSLQNELTLLLKTRLEPETIVFPYKESLYRKEETDKAPVVPINWKRYAAAAALLLAVSTTAFFTLRNNNKNENSPGQVANVKPVDTKPSPAESTTIKQLPAEEPTLIAKTTDDKDNNPSIQKEQQEEKNVAVKTKAVDKMLPQQSVPSPVKPNNNEIAQVIKPIEKQHNNLPEPKYNPYINEVKPEDRVIAMNEPSKNPSLTKGQQNIIDPPVTTKVDDSFIQTSNPIDESVAVNQPGGNKNKLRGFFRKLTRTFEKNTNIKATDEEDRLLVGGLAIRL